METGLTIHIRKLVPVLLVSVLILSILACNAVNLLVAITPAPQITATVVTTATAASGAVRNLEDLEKAVVHIETEGTYREPSEGLKVDAEGSGTGFIIDPAGIAVTNNHVVAGATLLRVWISGETEPRSAVVLGTSECSDLAVIEIDGDGFAFLEWYEPEIRAGLDVYTAGFPISGAGIGYTLTKGIVSKPQGSVNWSVASVDNIIEHTARINPGNSGGPLVTGEALVLGVNFGFNSTLDQNYAVARDEARPIIEKLRGGTDVNSLGINGIGVQGQLQGREIVGVWVRSVKAGSPADLTGIRPGDIITHLGEERLSDGTLGGYCTIVRTSQPGQPIDVTVIRSDNLDVYTGQFNGPALARTSTMQDLATPAAGDLGNPNANQPGEIFFKADFDEPDNWYTTTVPNSEDYEATTDGGKLRLFIEPKEVTLYTFYELDLNNPDVRIETLAQKIEGPNSNNISLVCRVTDAGFYEFSMTSGGYWNIYLYKVDGDKYTYTVLSSGASTAAELMNKPNELAAVCAGDLLIFYINGVKVGSTNDSTFPGGGEVGVSIWGKAVGLRVEFEYFTASVPVGSPFSFNQQ
ncbi:MAG: hypothetical protein A2Z16_09350 [Chloroflexi bacterium RBG_16_54_18]|nr:MAG: hypothetical protein A2Z16_09350 [Chloroflexi bacterium RBG_16_54_18]